MVRDDDTDPWAMVLILDAKANPKKPQRGLGPTR